MKNINIIYKKIDELKPYKNNPRKNEYSDIYNATFSVEFASHFIRNFAKESVLD